MYRTRPSQPLIDIWSLNRCAACTRWNVVTVVQTAGTIRSAPGKSASVDFAGAVPELVRAERATVVGHLPVDVVPPEDQIDPERDDGEDRHRDRAADLGRRAGTGDLDLLGHVGVPLSRRRAESASVTDGQDAGEGVANGTRTRDHRDHNPGLYQLSYRHLACKG